LSPKSSSSSIELGEGEGVESDWRLDEAELFPWLTLCDADERAAGKGTLGESILKPFDGESAEKR